MATPNETAADLLLEAALAYGAWGMPDKADRCCKAADAIRDAPPPDMASVHRELVEHVVIAANRAATDYLDREEWFRGNRMQRLTAELRALLGPKGGQ